MSRLIPLTVILVCLVAAPVAHAQEVKTFDCAAYGTGCENRIPATGDGGAGSFMTPSVITVPAGLNPNCVIEDLDVSIMIEHAARGNLVVALQEPGGTSVTLWNNVGATGNHFMVTVDDEAATQIQA
ncbi:MAG: proprotein convertase P-domain-containing protein, partial [Phycisphaerales bacterium]